MRLGTKRGQSRRARQKPPPKITLNTETQQIQLTRPEINPKMAELTTYTWGREDPTEKGEEAEP